MSTPAAPSISAAARPRPSAIPPAATTGTSFPTASTTRAASAIKPRPRHGRRPRRPARPGVGARRDGLARHRQRLHLARAGTPAPAMRSRKLRTDRRRTASPRRLALEREVEQSACLAMLQVMKPTPKRARIAASASSSRESQASSP